MSGTPRHLTLLFCATAGKQGEDIGTDECQLVQIVYLIYDVLNNKVSSLSLINALVKYRKEKVTDHSTTSQSM